MLKILGKRESKQSNGKTMWNISSYFGSNIIKKGKMKQVKLSLTLYFISLHISKIVSFQHTINIKNLLIKYITFSFFCTVFKIHCVFFTYSPSQFRHDTFLVLKRYIWLVTTILESEDLGMSII